MPADLQSPAEPSPAQLGRSAAVPEQIIDKAARDLDLQVPIENACYAEGGTLVIITRYGSHELPAIGQGKTDTSPGGPSQPASLGTDQPAVSPKLSEAEPETAKLSEAQPPTGGSVPPTAPGPPSPGAGPEPPPMITHSEPAESPPLGDSALAETGTVSADFTAIDGVGPATAQRLHDLGLYTFDDIRNWQEALDQHLPANRARSIRAWLAQRPAQPPG